MNHSDEPRGYRPQPDPPADLPASPARIPWTRWIVPIDTPIDVESPQIPWLIAPSATANGTCTTVGRIAARRAWAAVLGEPGSGKSDALSAWAAEHPATVQRINIIDCPTESMFERDLAAVRLADTAAIIVDGLDEARVPVDQVVAQLAAWCRREHATDAAIIVTCRTAHWVPEAWSAAAERLQREATVYEICPLTHADVAATATAYGVKAENFVAAVLAAAAGALAARPMTLMPLVRQFAKGQSLGTSRVELLDESLRHMLAEPSARRREGNAAAPTSAEMWLVASAIAAALVLGQNRHILRRGAIGTCDDAALDRNSLAPLWTVPPLNGISVDVLDAVLDTALFNAIGTGAIGFAHASFAERLASSWLETLELRALTSIFVRSQAGRTGVPRAWRDTAALLAARRPDFAKFLLAHDLPSLLAAELPPLLKHEVVVAALESTNRGELFLDWDQQRALARELPETVSPVLLTWLQGRRRSVGSRRLAARLAWFGQRRELAAAIAEAAEREVEPALREDLAVVALDLLDPHDGRLKRAARGRWLDDPDDDLRGAAIDRLAEHRVVPFAKLLRYLKPPSNDSRSGRFDSAVDTVADSIQLDDLTDLVDWLKARPRVPHRFLVLLVAGAIRVGREAGPSPQIAPLRDLAIWSFGDGLNFDVRDAWYTAYKNDDAGRRKLLGDLFDDAALTDDVANTLATTLGLLQNEDLLWVAMNAGHSTTRHWFTVLEMGLHTALPAPLWMAIWDQLYPLLDDPRMISLRQQWVDAREIDDPRYATNRKIARQATARLQRAAEQKQEAYDRMLDVSKPVDRRWRMIRTALPEPLQLTTLPLANIVGWPELVHAIGANLLDELATGFLEVAGPPQFDDSWDHVFAAGALQVVQPLLRADLARWSIVVRDRWFDAIIRLQSSEQTDWRDDLKSFAMDVAGDLIVSRLSTRLRAAALAGEPTDAFQRIGRQWRPAVSVAACALIRELLPYPAYAATLFAQLARRDPAMAQQFGDELIHRTPAIHPEIAGACLRVLPIEVLDAIRQYPRPYVAATLRFARSEALDRCGWLSCVEQAEQLEFVYSSIAWQRDSDRAPFYDRWDSFRADVLKRLVDLGSVAAMDVLASLAARRSPDRQLIRYSVYKIADRLIAEATTPLGTGDLAKVRRQDARWVDDAASLQNLVAESLGRYEDDLQRTSPPGSPELWAYGGTRNQRTDVRPKVEEDFSDHLARFLIRDLRMLAVGRELEITPNKVDIGIAAFPRAGGASSHALHVVVEVKGSWNPKVRSAVTDQLINKYLRPSGYRHGIYVVGWYQCEAWSPARRKPSRLAARTIEEARVEVPALAGEASTDGFQVVGIVLDCRLTSKTSGHGDN